MYNNIFDSHAHYDDTQFESDCRSLLSQLQNFGVCGVVNCATELTSCEKSRQLAEEFPFVYFAVGIHPHEAEQAEKNFTQTLEKFSKHPKCVAIGEIGLDYHYDFSEREIQKRVFEEQLKLAKELDLPVIIHDREAHSDTWELLNKYRPAGIVHCFSGSVESAKEIIKIGMYIGLGGAVTFKNAKKPVEVAKYVPLDRLVLETDCPYMSPVPYRGKRNDSTLISYTAEFISQLKGISTQSLLDKTAENARNVFGISE